MKTPRLMLVDDEEYILRALERSLQAGGPRPLEIEAYTDPYTALLATARRDYAMVIADYRMPKMDGVFFLSAFKEIRPLTIRMILSGHADREVLADAINQAEIHRFLGKPWDDEELRAVVGEALERHRRETERQRLAQIGQELDEACNRQARELERLERLCPGITRVEWGPDGSVRLDEDS